MAKATFFIGIPCSGKTTHRKKHHSNDFVVSRDDLREKVIEEHGLEYADLFESPQRNSLTPHPKLGKVTPRGNFELSEKANDEVSELFDMHIKGAINELFSGRDVVVDLLNFNAKERKPYLKLLGGIEGVELHAKVFEFKPHLDRIRALNEVRSANGKVIPEKVLMGFVKGFQAPSLSEGFDHIEMVDELSTELTEA